MYLPNCIVGVSNVVNKKPLNTYIVLHNTTSKLRFIKGKIFNKLLFCLLVQQKILDRFCKTAFLKKIDDKTREK